MEWTASGNQGLQAADILVFTPFPFHRKGRIFRTAGDPVFVQRTVRVRKGDSSVKGDVRFFNGSVLQEVFIDFNGNRKPHHPGKVLGLMRGCFRKKSFNTGMSALESARLLSSSGESDFFPIIISGCASRKSLLKKEMSLTMPSPFVTMPNLNT